MIHNDNWNPAERLSILYDCFTIIEKASTTTPVLAFNSLWLLPWWLRLLGYQRCSRTFNSLWLLLSFNSRKNKIEHSVFQFFMIASDSHHQPVEPRGHHFQFFMIASKRFQGGPRPHTLAFNSLWLLRSMNFRKSMPARIVPFQFFMIASGIQELKLKLYYQAFNSLWLLQE